MTESDASKAASPPEPAGAEPPAEERRPAAVELQPLGGRLWIGVGMLVGIALISWQTLNLWIDRLVHPTAPRPVATWQVGTEADVEVTLITPDAKRLNCAHDAVIEEVHCGYAANKRPWRRAPNAPLDDNDELVIQPYRTADTNALILVSGLWAQPELALRLHREPPNVSDVDKNLRFVAYCRVRFVGELERVSLRWDNAGKWAEEPKALVAKPLRCTLEPPNG
jgi:hypothetical protein